MIRIIAGIVVVILAFLIGRILIQGLPHISWKFLTTSSKAFTSGGGIGIQLFNSFYLLILTLIISFPISLGAGIFLAEYAPKNALTNVIRMAIEILSSLPSVVVGLFGFLLFVVQFKLGFSILSGAIALTFFNLPLLTRNIEDSLNSVPKLQREAGLALGLSKMAYRDQGHLAGSNSRHRHRHRFVCRQNLWRSCGFDLHGRTKRNERRLYEMESVRCVKSSEFVQAGGNFGRAYLENKF